MHLARYSSFPDEIVAIDVSLKKAIHFATMRHTFPPVIVCVLTAIDSRSKQEPVVLVAGASRLNSAMAR